jgi:hypothetical protein
MERIQNRILASNRISFQEWGKRRIKENGGGGEFKYDTFDIL